MVRIGKTVARFWHLLRKHKKDIINLEPFYVKSFNGSQIIGYMIFINGVRQDKRLAI